MSRLSYVRASINGRKALFCTPACRDGFREDRRYGAIYGPYRREDGGFYLNAEEYSRDTLSCAYCNADLDSTAPENGRTGTTPTTSQGKA